MSKNARSVLVVEDDQEINSMVGAYAQLCGFNYRPALNGAAAIDAALAETPSLIILDLMLPDIDGFEICSRLKSTQQTRDIPVVMLTAMCSDEHRERALRCGAADYLTKPFDPDRLMQAILNYAGPAPE